MGATGPLRSGRGVHVVFSRALCWRARPPAGALLGQPWSTGQGEGFVVTMVTEVAALPGLWAGLGLQGPRAGGRVSANRAQLLLSVADETPGKSAHRRSGAPGSPV